MVSVLLIPVFIKKYFNTFLLIINEKKYANNLMKNWYLYRKSCIGSNDRILRQLNQGRGTVRGGGPWVGRARQPLRVSKMEGRRKIAYGINTF